MARYAQILQKRSGKTSLGTQTPLSKRDFANFYELNEKPLTTSEKELVEKITASLKRHNGNMKQAAKFIGMPYPTFYYYVKKHSIKGVVLDGTSERKLSRINDYCKLRKNGTILADAAKAIGVSMQTAYSYEVIFNNKK